MQQRIPVSDPRLAARIVRIVADLEKYYPDHLVSRVAIEHKSLDGRITKAYRDAGYDSRASFYEAYGFKTDVAKMGRPTASFDVDRLVAEFEARYEGKPKPASLGDLKAQNPDLVGKLKTFGNQAKLLTGKTAAAYLKERGILVAAKTNGSPKPVGGVGPAAAAAPKARKAPAGNAAAKVAVATKDAKAAIDKMAGAGIEASVVLKAANKGAAAIGASVHANAVFSGDVSCDEDALAAIDLLVHKFDGVAWDDVPATLSALKEQFPLYAKAIEYAVQRGFGADCFASIGLVQGNRLPLWIRGDGGMVSVSAELGVDECVAAGIPLVIVPGSDDAKLLPPHVIGIDVKRHCELHEYIAFVQGDSVDGLFKGAVVGIHRVPREFAAASDSNETYTSAGVACVVQRIVELDGKPFIRLQKNGFLTDIAQSSLLEPYEGGEVVLAGRVDGVPCAFVRVRAMRSLQHDTLMWLLRDAGIVNDADLRGGAGWRWRLMRHGGANPFATTG